MNNIKISAVLFLSFLFMLGQVSYPQQSNFTNFNFLIGEWIGMGGGSISGKGAGGSIFKYDLDSNLIVRENYAQYPEQNNNPVYTHKDLMIIYFQSVKPKAVYFDNEKHVINYNIEFSDNKIIFISEEIKGIPQFRLTYEREDDNKMKLYFDIAPPNAPGKFKSFLTAGMHKK
jgi:hypothetical protein